MNNNAETRQNIINAFWSLYKEKRIEKISINEITRLSGNNRTTFYHYFLDVYDLLEQIEQDLLKDVDAEIEAQLERLNITENSALSFDMVLQIISPIFKKNEEKIFVLLGSHGDPKFSQILQERMKTNITNVFNTSIDLAHIDYIITYVYSAIIGLLTHWYQMGHDLTDDEFLHLAYNLISSGLQGAVGSELAKQG